MASSSSKERKRLYNKKRYASMDYTSKERQKEMMREYNNKRIYGFTSSMASDELYTCNNTSIENESSHIEGGNASINEIHQRKKNTVLDIERKTQIAKEHSHENILEDEIEDLDESDDVIIFPSEESWLEIDGLFEDGETNLNATMTLASARNESESNDPFDFVYHGLPPSPNILQKQRDCKFCKAKRFQYEFPTFCCMNGKISLAPNEVPDELYRLFTTEEPDGVSFRHFIRCYNSHFSFTSLGATVDKNLANMRDGVYTFRAHGQIYHFLDQLVSQNEPKYLQLYFYDTDIELDQRMDRTPNLDRSTVQILMGVLSNNPYAQTFKMLRDIPTLDNYRITLNASVRELDQRTHNKPTASQVGAVWVEGNGDQTSYKRSIVTLRNFYN